MSVKRITAPDVRRATLMRPREMTGPPVEKYSRATGDCRPALAMGPSRDAITVAVATMPYSDGEKAEATRGTTATEERT
jgi:hypothetical protein